MATGEMGHPQERWGLHSKTGEMGSPQEKWGLHLGEVRALQDGDHLG